MQSFFTCTISETLSKLITHCFCCLIRCVEFSRSLINALMLPDSASFIMIELRMLIYKASHSPRVKHLTWRWPCLVCHLRTRACLTGIETPLKSGKSDTIFCFNQQQARSLSRSEGSHCIVDEYMGAFVTMRRRFCYDAHDSVAMRLRS